MKLHYRMKWGWLPAGLFIGSGRGTKRVAWLPVGVKPENEAEAEMLFKAYEEKGRALTRDESKAILAKSEEGSL